MLPTDRLDPCSGSMLRAGRIEATRSRNTFATVLGEGLAACRRNAVALSIRDSAALLDATCGGGGRSVRRARRLQDLIERSRHEFRAS